jgi:hypothetical protein
MAVTNLPECSLMLPFHLDKKDATCTEWWLVFEGDMSKTYKFTKMIFCSQQQHSAGCLQAMSHCLMSRNEPHECCDVAPCVEAFHCGVALSLCEISILPQHWNVVVS